MHPFDVGSTVYNHSIVQFDPFKIRSSLLSWMKKLKSDAKKKEKTEYVFRWKEDKLSFVIYVTNTLAHTPRRAFLWTDFPFISLKTTPLTEAETAACLTAITSIQYKDSVTKTRSDAVADQLYQSLSSSKRTEFIHLSILRHIKWICNCHLLISI